MPRGAKSDEAYVREVLGGLASARNLLIVNDEAHHAWRVPAESKRSKALQERIEETLQVLEQFEATTWGIALREIDGEQFVVLPPGALTGWTVGAQPAVKLSSE